MKLEDIDKAETWEVGAAKPLMPPGTFIVRISGAAEGTSSGGYSQLELELENDQYAIRDWQVVTPASRGKVKQILEAAGIEIVSGDWDFKPEVLVGKKVRIIVGEEPSYKDPSKTRTVVQGYTPYIDGEEAISDVPIDLSEGKSADDKIPF